MNRLVKTNLLYDGLVRLDTPALVARYNSCLETAGIAPVALDSLQIDGAGWSPEVAREKGDIFYLCHNLANPLAIIVSPMQFKKPVYHAPFSWMRRLLRTLFDGSFSEIRDITATHGIVLDFENGLGSLNDPADLLLLTAITPVIHTGGLAEAAKEQADLIGTFLQDDNCLKEPIRQALREHRLAHGDLRKRRVAIELSRFDAFQDFYTAAYGGAAVLRGVDGVDLLVLEDKKTYRSVANADLGARVFHLADSSHALFRLLLRAGWLRVPVARYRENPEHLENKRAVLLAWSLHDLEPELAWNAMRSPQQKALVSRHRETLPAIYKELERFKAALLGNRKLPALSDELTLYLAEPSQDLHPATQEVLWILLTRKEPRNLLELYTYDKNYFLELYQKFPESKRAWAANHLKRHYVQRMNQ